MRDRKGTNDLVNGAVRYGAYDAAGNPLRQVWLRLEDEPLAEETPLVKANLLTDETAALLWTVGDAPADPTINDALDKLSTPQYKIGDLLVTVRELAAPWHACDGSAFSQTDYPELYNQLGGNALPNVSYSDDTVTYIKMAND